MPELPAGITHNQMISPSLFCALADATADALVGTALDGTVLFANAATEAASRCFVGPHPLASSPDRFRTIVPGGPHGEPVTAALSRR